MVLQELEPWTTTTSPAVLHDIGPMAAEAVQRHGHLQQLLTAVHHTRSAHDKLLALKTHNAPHGHSEDLDAILTKVSVQHKGLQMQHQMLCTVQSRLNGVSYRHPQLADL